MEIIKNNPENKKKITRQLFNINSLPLRTVLYGTLLVILNTRLGVFPESGPFAFLSLELFEGGGSSSSETSSILHS